MATKFEQRSQSLLASRSLDTARANFRTPDIGVGLRIMAKGIFDNEDELKALEEQREAAALGGSLPVIDETGKYVRYEAQGGTPSSRRALYQALDMNYSSALEAQLSDGFNRIQSEDLPTAEKVSRMSSYAQGALESMPDEIKAQAIAYAQGQINARANALAAQDIRQNEQIADQEFVANNKRDAELAISAVIAGDADAGSMYRKRIQDRYQNWVQRGKMSQAVANASVESLNSEITRRQMGSILLDKLFAQEIAPADLQQFSVELTAGGAANLYGRGKDGERAVILDNEVLNKMGLQLSDREQLAQHLRMAVTYWNSRVAETADLMAMHQSIADLGPTRQLSSEYKKPYEALIERLTEGDWASDDEKVRAVAGLFAKTRRGTESVYNQLYYMVQSDNPAIVANGINAYRTIVNARNGMGMDVGVDLRRDIPSDKRAMLDSALRAADLNMPVDVIGKAIAKINSMSIADREQLQRQYHSEFARAAKGSEDVDIEVAFSTEVLKRWDERTEGKFGMVPPGFLAEVKEAYFFNKLVDNGGQTLDVFERAFEQVASTYSFGEAALKSGYTMEPIENLHNPPSYVGVEGNDVEASPDDQLLGSTPTSDPLAFTKDYITNSIRFYAKLDGEMGVDIDNIAALQNADLQVGKNVFIEPVKVGDSVLYEVYQQAIDPSQPPMPIRLRNGDTLRLDLSGNVSRQIERDKRKASLEAIDEATIKVQREKYLEFARRIDPRRQARGSIPSETELFADNPELGQEYNVEKARIAADAQRAVDNLAVTAGEEIPMDRITRETIFRPNVAGSGVVSEVVNQIERVFPDGTGGRFLYNIAAAESHAATFSGTYAMDRSDRGPWQINVGDRGAFAEIKRLLNTRNHWLKDWAARAEKAFQLQPGTIKNLKPEDMNIPLYNGLFARFYMARKMGRDFKPQNIQQEAEAYKLLYNTYDPEARGSVDGYIKKVKAYGRG